MRRVIRSVKSAFSDVTGFGGFHVWRGLERCLSVQALCAVARGFYICRATFNELFRRSSPLREEPEWLWTDGSLRARISRRTQKYLNYLMKCFPDRIGQPKWRSRCRWEGVEQLEAARKAGHPLIVVFYHFGPVYIMQQWVRARGIQVSAFIGGTPEARSKLMRHQDRLMPFPMVPVAFFAGQLRALTKFLQAGNILFIAMDADVGHCTTAEVDGWTINLNSGPARLANGAGANLLLASIVTEGPWQFRVKFSSPIPALELRTPADWEKANQRLLEAILPDFKAYPEQFDLPRPWKRKPPG